MALYSDIVMDHFMHPRNVGEIPDADGVGQVGNAKCGDIMKMYLKIKDDRIEDVKLAVTNRQVVDALGGLPAHKLHCSVLAEESIKSAVKDYYDRNGIAYDRSKFPEDCGSCESCRMV